MQISHLSLSTIRNACIAFFAAAFLISGCNNATEPFDVYVQFDHWTAQDLEKTKGCDYEVSLQLDDQEPVSFDPKSTEVPFGEQGIFVGTQFESGEIEDISRISVTQVSTQDPFDICLVKELQCRIRQDVLTASFNPDVVFRTPRMQCGIPVVFVAPNGRGTRDGSSWENAAELKEAVKIAEEMGPDQFKEIWLEAGKYHDPVDGNLNGSILTVGSRTSVYGGFKGDEFLLEERKSDFSDTESGTILDGDILQDRFLPTDVSGSHLEDNSLHVVKVSGSNIVLSGLSIKNGHIPLLASNEDDESNIQQSGAGLHIESKGNILIQDVNISENTGYCSAQEISLDSNASNQDIHPVGVGVFVIGSEADEPINFERVSVSRNHLEMDIGAFFPEHDSLLLCAGAGGASQNIFIDWTDGQIKNNITKFSGAGWFAGKGSSLLFNRLQFFGNHANGYGGALFCENDTDCRVNHSVIARNRSFRLGGGVFNGDLEPDTNTQSLEKNVSSYASFFHTVFVDNVSGGGSSIYSNGSLSLSSSAILSHKEPTQMNVKRSFRWLLNAHQGVAGSVVAIFDRSSKSHSLSAPGGLSGNARNFIAGTRFVGNRLVSPGDLVWLGGSLESNFLIAQNSIFVDNDVQPGYAVGFSGVISGDDANIFLSRQNIWSNNTVKVSQGDNFVFEGAPAFSVGLMQARGDDGNQIQLAILSSCFQFGSFNEMTSPFLTNLEMNNTLLEEGTEVVQETSADGRLEFKNTDVCSQSGFDFDLLSREHFSSVQDSAVISSFESEVSELEWESRNAEECWLSQIGSIRYGGAMQRFSPVEQEAVGSFSPDIHDTESIRLWGTEYLLTCFGEEGAPAAAFASPR